MSSTPHPRTRTQGLLFGVLALVLALCVWLPACSAQTKSGKEKMDKLKYAVDNLLGRLRRIPNAGDTRYLIDSLVTTTPAGSSFVLESINCDADTANQRYSCTLKSSAFKK